MRGDADREYHKERARAELDAAYRAAGSDAAKAHLGHCSLQMARVGTLLEQARRVRTELDWIESFRPLHERSLAGAG